MGYPITGEAGKIYSITSATALNTFFAALRVLSLDFKATAPTEDVSGDGYGYTQKVSGLTNASFDFKARYPKSAPSFGNGGQVTYASGYVQYVESFQLDFDFGEVEFTSYTGSAVTANLYRPFGRPVITGSYVARAVNDTALSMPSAVNSGGGTATFKIAEDGSADPAFSGKIVIQDKSFEAGTKDLVKVTYAFEAGDKFSWTSGSTLPDLFAAGDIGAFEWDKNGDGVPDVSVVLQTISSRTYTGNAYLSKFSVVHAVNKPIEINGTVRFSGAVTTA